MNRVLKELKLCGLTFAIMIGGFTSIIGILWAISRMFLVGIWLANEAPLVLAVVILCAIFLYFRSLVKATLKVYHKDEETKR